jgi:hypothetical protein
MAACSVPGAENGMKNDKKSPKNVDMTLFSAVKNFDFFLQNPLH